MYVAFSKHDSRNDIFLYHLCMSVVMLFEHIHVWTILHRVLSLEIFLLIRAELSDAECKRQVIITSFTCFFNIICGKYFYTIRILQLSVYQNTFMVDTILAKVLLSGNCVGNSQFTHVLTIESNLLKKSTFSVFLLHCSIE